MKCPKCGSNNIRTERRPNGFNWCNECGHQWQSGIKSPEPTTAEMLLWLFYNTNFRIRNDGELGYYQNECFTKFEYEFQNKSKDEAIKQAYDWAKQEDK